MNSTNALSSVEHVLASADQFFAIADAIHRRLNSSSARTEFATDSADLYGMLIEEYGLRARAAILRNNAAHHIVMATRTEQARLEHCLEAAAARIIGIAAPQLRSVVASVNTLCVAISPGKGHVVDFLIRELENDLQIQAQCA